MKETSFIISGFGGQGALFAGQVMAYAAMDADLFVTWIPSYGPEMRGGTVHSTVIISEEEISSPLVRRPDVTIVFNLPSLMKYEPLTKPCGVLIANSSLIDRELKREDLTLLFVPANQIAEEIGLTRLANMVMIGSMLKLVPILSVEMIKNALISHIPKRHHNTLSSNYEAIDKGFAFAERALAQIVV